MRKSIWIWQRIVSPHMAGLASALADRGNDVTYVAEQAMSGARIAQGWQPPDIGKSHLIYAPDTATTAQVARSAPEDSVHICQGLRANGLVATAQAILAGRGMAQWVVMETVENAGWRGLLRRLEYRRLIAARQLTVKGYLATGYETPEWLIQRGARAISVFPFAYFLPESLRGDIVSRPEDNKFRIIFVGRLIKLKQLELLIRTLAWLGRDSVELYVIGSGPLANRLRRLGVKLLGDRLHWIGGVPSNEVSAHMSAADLLVLPSRYDGWGAVVSEALMVGTPVVCSDRCGSAGVVKFSEQGGVFPSNDGVALAALLSRSIDRGRISTERRRNLAQWARKLGARAGAEYLTAILAFSEGCGDRPQPPWATSEITF